jgi:hypothetical protein
MGPNEKESDVRAEQAYDDIIQLLEKKYYITDYKQGICYNDVVDSKEKLKTVLKELFWNDAVNTF